MTSFRQIEANRRNAQLSSGPITEEGKKQSRQNAVRHGLTAETVIDALEDAEDYAAFEMAVTADYDPQSAVERELVLRLASLLWRLRRATAIESGLFKIQAKHLLQFRQRRQAHPEPPKIIDSTYRNGFASEEDIRQDHDEPMSALDPRAPVSAENADQGGDLTRSFVRLSNLPTYPLDRLSRYEEPRCGASVSDSVHATVSRPPQAMGEAWVATSSRSLKYVRSGTNCVETRRPQLRSNKIVVKAASPSDGLSLQTGLPLPRKSRRSPVLPRSWHRFPQLHHFDRPRCVHGLVSDLE